MPTPMRFFVKVAQKWGNIDPDDHQAVENWYVKELPKLPKKNLNAILDELMQFSQEESIKPDKIVYPSDVPYPLMKNLIPASGYTLTNYYTQIAKYLRKLIMAGNRK